MAYVANGVKAVLAGGGKAPSIFTYNSRADLLADVTTLGYFDLHGGSGLFEVNDIIYLRYNDGVSYGKIICVKNDREAPQGQKTDFSTTSSFAGDISATDEAGYQSDNFGVGMGSAQGVFMQYTYRNNTDTEALIVADDYFLDAGTFLEVDDIIEGVSVDGHFMLMVTVATATNVTVRPIVFI